MKPIFLFIMITTIAIGVFAQKQTFDIVSYTPPAGWNKDTKADFVSFSRIDGAGWSQIAVYKSRQSSGNIEEDVQKDWQDIVLAGHTIEQEDKTTPNTAEGWQVMSRSGVWQYNGANVATVLTTYSNGNVCVSVLWNGTAQPYMKNLKDFIASIDLDANAAAKQSDAVINEQNNNLETMDDNNTASVSETFSIAGLWTYYTSEGAGFSGYMRREYQFNMDGTYTYRNKQWLTTAPNIIFMYETGTYTVQGDQLTLTPKNGKAGFWGKRSSTKEWGPLKKSSNYKLEKTTYTFEIINDPTYGNAIILKAAKATLRDGAQSNNDNNPIEVRYSLRTSASSIDNPPGFKL